MGVRVEIERPEIRMEIREGGRRTFSYDEAVLRVWILEIPNFRLNEQCVQDSRDGRILASVISIRRDWVLFFSASGSVVCEMDPFLGEVADLPSMGDGRRRLDSSRYKGRVDAIAASPRRAAYVTEPGRGIYKGWRILMIRSLIMWTSLGIFPRLQRVGFSPRCNFI